MIRKISIENFYSFKEENTLSFMVHAKAPCSDAYIEAQKGERMTKILASFGANASGKTNLLKALPFISWFMKDSFDLKPDENIPLQSFRFEKDNTEPTKISVEFSDTENIYLYHVQLIPEQVMDENLFIRNNGRGFQYLFKRTWNHSIGKYNFATKNFGLTRSFGEFVQMRRNASVLSIALRHNHEESKKIIESWSRLITNVQEQGREGRMMVERTKQYSVLPSVPPHASMVKMGAEQGLKNGRFKVNHVSLEDMADKRQEALQFVEQIKYDNGPSQ